MRLKSGIPSLFLFVLALAVLTGTAPVAADLLCGDCNGDGLVNAADVSLAADMDVFPALRTGPRVAKCDVNGDGANTILDAFLIATPPPGGLSCPICGDCDGDNDVDGDDTTFIAAIAGTAASPLPGTPRFYVCDTNGDGSIGPPDGTTNSPRCGKCGDCNHDGQFGIADALVAAQHISGQLTVAPGCQFRACDVDGSGGISSTDVLLLIQASSGLIPPPTGCR